VARIAATKTFSFYAGIWRSPLSPLTQKELKNNENEV
jgi:hypothetical protein